MSIEETKFDWNSLFLRYLEGSQLKHLSFEHTQDPAYPKFGTLRNFASRNHWRQKRREYWRLRQSDIKLRILSENQASVEPAENKNSALSISSGINAILESLQSPPSKHLDPHEEVSRFKREFAEFTRSRVEAETARREAAQASRRFDDFGRPINR